MTVSPLGLIQERVDRDRHYPWRVLVCCALLNQTHRRQVRPMFLDFFRLCPTPAALLVCPEDCLMPLLRPLGLQRRRAALLRRLTADYLSGLPPEECHGVGQYAIDAWALFVEGRTDVDPSDHFLKPYLDWRMQHGNAIEWARP